MAVHWMAECPTGDRYKNIAGNSEINRSLTWIILIPSLHRVDKGFYYGLETNLPCLIHIFKKPSLLKLTIQFTLKPYILSRSSIILARCNIALLGALFASNKSRSTSIVSWMASSSFVYFSHRFMKSITASQSGLFASIKPSIAVKWFLSGCTSSSPCNPCDCQAAR